VLFDLVEGSNEEEMIKAVIKIILAFNLQYTNRAENAIMKVVEIRETSRTFSEEIIVMFNRSEDMWSQGPCVKFMSDVMADPSTVC